ncbi:MAG: hypothetical protein ACR2KP_02520, partial [Egibacteraceae bacterium]
VDHEPREVAALTPDDPRVFTIRVAGRAALVVAKVHKISDRLGDASRGRAAGVVARRPELWDGKAGARIADVVVAACGSPRHLRPTDLP